MGFSIIPPKESELHSDRANKHPLAPCPQGPAEQWGNGIPGFSIPNPEPGRVASFSGGSNESLGAQHKITATQPQSRGQSTIEALSPSAHGGRVMPPAIERPEERVPAPHGNLGPVPPDWRNMGR